MKKTLVALAVLAATGTAFAQSSVTVSGKYRIAYESNENLDSTKTQGVGVTDGDIVFGSVEDLGAGMKASVSMALRLRGRSSSLDNVPDSNPGVRPRDASVSLSGGFGTVTMGSIDIGFLHSAGLTSLPTHGLDASISATTVGRAVILLGGNADILRYTSPSMSGFNVSVAVLDTVGGGGAESLNASADATVLGARYSAGPVLAVADYTTWDANALPASRAPDNRFRIAGNYNLGVAVLGLGYSDLKYANGGKRTETVASVTVPMGQISFGLNLARAERDQAPNPFSTTATPLANMNGTNEGTEAIVKYDLSKRTFLAAAYQATKVANAVAAAAGTGGSPKTESNAFRIQIGHSF